MPTSRQADEAEPRRPRAQPSTGDQGDGQEYRPSLGGVDLIDSVGRMDPHEASPLTGSRADEAVAVPSVPPTGASTATRSGGRQANRRGIAALWSSLAVVAAVAGSAALYNANGGMLSADWSSFWVSYPGLHWVDGNHTDDDGSKDDGDSSDTPDEATAEVGERTFPLIRYQTPMSTTPTPPRYHSDTKANAAPIRITPARHHSPLPLTLPPATGADRHAFRCSDRWRR